MNARTIRLTILAGATVAMLAGLAGTSAAAPAAAPAQQGLSCRWEKLSASMPQALYFSGAAWDSVQNRLYLNAGLDENNNARRAVQELNLAGPDIRTATAATVSVAGNQDWWGSVGGFRPAGDSSLALFAGGAAGLGALPLAADPEGLAAEGDGQRGIQGFTPKTRAWATLATLTQGVTLAAAAYDPAHGALVVVGGVRQCDFFKVDATNPLKCDDTVNTVSFVKFDPATGAASVVAGPTAGGPGRLLGGTLVYDSAGTRMLWFGGADGAGGNGKNAVYALDLKDPDLAKAAWSSLGTTGSAPTGRALHGAVYDTDRNWMVVYGGVGRGYFTNGENTLTDAIALDLGQAPPRWVNLGASQPGERVGAAMAYDANHKAVVLTSGRRKFSDSGNQNVLRDNWYLSCTVQATATPTATRDPNITPSPTPTRGSGPGPGWTPEPCVPKVCPGLERLVPAQHIADALANPAKTNGYCMLQNPGVPPSPVNRYRTWLTLRNRGAPFNPMTNSVVYKVGCY